MVLDNSEVLARKYRPKRFEDLIGQSTITQTLSLALDSKRLSHAYLLSGLRGSGKTSTARIFAKSLVCEKAPTSHACDVCSHCLMANENRHMDIIEMDAASSRKIDDIRELIEHTKYKPASAQFKIFIIDEVHMLTKEAFNALLKTLEEPPAYIKFILATTDPLKLPATILSRTQHFRFKRINNADIVHHITHILNLENIQFEPAALEILARSGDGSVRDTLTLLDQAIIYGKNFVDVATITDMLGLIDPQFMQEIFQAIFSKDTKRILEFVTQLNAYEVDMIIDELIAYLKEQLFNTTQTTFPALLIERFFTILSDAKQLIALNADGEFILSLVFFKMVEALKLKDIENLINTLEDDMQKHPLSPNELSRMTTSASKIEHMELNTPIAPKEAQNRALPTPQQTPFDMLVQKFYDRSVELGNCFEEVVSFISYNKPALVLNFYGSDACTAMLREHYKEIVLPFILNVYGDDTKLEVTKNPVEKKKSLETTPHQDEPSLKAYEEKQNQPIEEAHNLEDSCVDSCVSPTATPSPEFDQGAILQDPMVQKAIELFGTKVTVQNKI